MKIQILTENFKKAISACERLTRKTTTLPVLQNVLIEAKDNFLELTTTNLETTMQWRVLAKVEKPGKVVVPATFLANLVNLITDNKIDLKEEGKNLILTTPNQEVQIQGQNPDDFPIIPKIEKDVKLLVSIDKLKDGLSQVVEIPSISQVRPEISGVYFNFKKDKLKVVATDSFRLAEKTIQLTSKDQKDGSFIIPQTTARELINILSQQEGSVTIFLQPNQISFEFSNPETTNLSINLLSRLIEGEYPNYQEIIPKKSSTGIQLNREDFLSQIKKAGLFSGKVLEVKLTISPKEKKLKLFSQSSEAGRNEAYLNCEVTGEAAEAAFNYRFLVDGLNNIKSSEVIFELGEQSGPGVLKAVGNSDYLYILMPIKAN